MLITLTIPTGEIRCFLEETSGRVWFCAADVGTAMLYKSLCRSRQFAGVEAQKFNQLNVSNKRPLMAHIDEDGLHKLANHPTITRQMSIHRKRVAEQIIAAYKHYVGPIHTGGDHAQEKRLLPIPPTPLPAGTGRHRPVRRRGVGVVGGDVGSLGR